MKGRVFAQFATADGHLVELRYVRPENDEAGDGVHAACTGCPASHGPDSEGLTREWAQQHAVECGARLMSRQYEERLAAYGLTDSQYRRAVAAHELGHGLLTAAAPTLDVKYIELKADRRGVHGGAIVGPARGYRKADPMEHAVELFAGRIAKARWLRDVERCWCRDLADLVDATAAGDQSIINRLGLSGSERSAAERQAEREVDRQWRGITQGVAKLARGGRMNGRQLRKLVRR